MQSYHNLPSHPKGILDTEENPVWEAFEIQNMAIRAFFTAPPQMRLSAAPFAGGEIRFSILPNGIFLGKFLIFRNLGGLFCKNLSLAENFTLTRYSYSHLWEVRDSHAKERVILIWVRGTRPEQGNERDSTLHPTSRTPTDWF